MRPIRSEYFVLDGNGKKIATFETMRKLENYCKGNGLNIEWGVNVGVTIYEGTEEERQEYDEKKRKEREEKRVRGLRAASQAAIVTLLLNYKFESADEFAEADWFTLENYFDPDGFYGLEKTVIHDETGMLEDATVWF